MYMKYFSGVHVNVVTHGVLGVCVVVQLLGESEGEVDGEGEDGGAGRRRARTALPPAGGLTRTRRNAAR